MLFEICSFFSFRLMLGGICMSIAFCSGQYSNIIVLCRGLGKGMTSPFKHTLEAIRVYIYFFGSKKFPSCRKIQKKSWLYLVTQNFKTLLKIFRRFAAIFPSSTQIAKISYASLSKGSSDDEKVHRKSQIFKLRVWS